MKISKLPKTNRSSEIVLACSQEKKYRDTEEYIRCAIDCLGRDAKHDPKAREAIANLGVILLDLKN